MRYRHFMIALLMLAPLQGPSKPASGAEAKGADVVEKLPAPTKRKVVLHRVDFEADSAVIQPEAFPVLEEATALLTGDEQTTIVVNEPNDSGSSVAYRSVLVRRRAQAVRRFLTRHGSTARLTIEGLDQPPPSLATRAGDGGAHNRPAELRIE
jgi:outer membrane protein OmpA-like peptidoglycan-associated protein